MTGISRVRRHVPGGTNFVRTISAGLLASVSLLATTPAFAQDAALLERLEALEARFLELESENRELREELDELQASAEQPAPVEAGQPLAAGPVDVVTEADDPREMQVAGSENFVGTNGSYAYGMLDHAENVNSKPLVQLEALRDGELTDRVTLSGQVTAIANYQWSDTDDKFGYLMRHPTANNQLGPSGSNNIHNIFIKFKAALLHAITTHGT